MDSLLNDIQSVIRAGRLEEALGLLKMFLISVFSAYAPLQKECQRLERRRDSLMKQVLSGVALPNYDTFMASVDSAIAKAEENFAMHNAEYSSCAAKLGTIIDTLTGQRYTDTMSRFIADFTLAARGMARRVEDLSMVHINGFIASYATVCGDGACFFRAFLTVMAYQEANVVLPYNPEGMQEWIIRLKLLMCAHIQGIVHSNPQFVKDLQSIPENGTVRNLQEYFVKFISPDYYGTNYDCKILSAMLGKPIHVIRENPARGETHQTFLPGSAQIQTIEPDHYTILYQHCHYVAIIDFFHCDLRPAISPEF